MSDLQKSKRLNLIVMFNDTPISRLLQYAGDMEDTFST